jgi:hypothetical protein
MNRVPPSPPDDFDAVYRKAAGADPGAPSASVRRAILDHATGLAAQRGAQASASGARRRAAWNWRWATMFGGLAAAVLAGLLIAPRFLMTPEPASAPTARAGAPAASPAAPAVPTNALTTPALKAAPAAPPATSAEPSTPSARIPAPTAAPSVQAFARPTAPAATRPDEADRLARTNPVPAAAPEKRDRLARRYDEAASSRDSLDRQRAASAEATGEALSENSVGSASIPSVAPPTGAGIQTNRAQSGAAPTFGIIDSAAALRAAAESGDLARLKALLAEQVDLEARDSAGRTALLLAVLHGQARAVDALLAAGADPNSAAMDGLTPLHAARNAHEASIAAALRRGGAR